jgi:hypothetical protein
MAWAPDSYVSTEELTAHVRVGDTVDDAPVSLAIAAASRAIDYRCRRQFGRVAVAEPRVYTPRWSSSRAGWLVPVDDLMTAAGLLVTVDRDGDGTYETAVTGYRLRPTNAVVRGWPWTELLIPSSAAVGYRGGPDSVQVTALWGWSGIPDGIRQACLLQASRLLSRRDSPFGVAGSPEAGSELRLLSRLDPDVQVAVEPYRRRVWAA